MGRIITNTATENPETKFQVNTRDKDKQTDTASVAELDFADLHILFEKQYEQLLNDTSDEMAKRTQRVLELSSIVYQNS